MSFSYSTTPYLPGGQPYTATWPPCLPTTEAVTTTATATKVVASTVENIITMTVEKTTTLAITETKVEEHTATDVEVVREASSWLL
jgi:carbohydrate-binding DOMON domain-containing protein